MKIQGPLKPASSNIDVKSLVANNTPSIDKGSIDDLTTLTKDKASQNMIGRNLTKFFGGDEKAQTAAGYLSDSMILDDSDRGKDDDSVFGSFKKVSSSIWNIVKDNPMIKASSIIPGLVSNFGAISDPEQFLKEKEKETNTRASNIYGAQLVKEENAVQQNLETKNNEILNEKARLKAEFAGLNPESNTYFDDVARLESKKIGIDTKQNIFNAYKIKYLSNIAKNVKPKEYDNSILTTYFDDKENGAKYLDQFRGLFFEDGKHKATQMQIDGDNKGAALQQGVEQSQKKILNKYTKEFYEIGKNLVEAGQYPDIDTYLNSEPVINKMKSIVGEAGNIVKANPYLLNKNTGLIDPDVFDLKVKENKLIRSINGELEVEYDQAKLEKRGAIIENRKQSNKDFVKGIMDGDSFINNTTRFISEAVGSAYNYGGQGIGFVIDEVNKSQNPYRGTEKSGDFNFDGINFGTSRASKLVEGISGKDRAWYTKSLSTLTEHPGDILGIIVGMASAVSSTRYLSAANQSKIPRMILSGIDDALNGLPLNLGINGATGDYNPKSDFFFDFIGGAAGNLKGIISNIDKIAEEAVHIASKQSPEASRLFLRKQGLSLATPDVTDKQSIINSYKLMAESFADYKNQLSLNEFKKFMQKGVDDITAADPEEYVTMVRRIQNSFGGGNITKLFGNSAAEITEAAGKGDLTTVKRIAQDTLNQLSSKQVTSLLKNTIDAAKLDALARKIKFDLGAGLKGVPEDIIASIASKTITGSDDFTYLRNLDYFKLNPSKLNETFKKISSVQYDSSKWAEQLSPAGMKKLSEAIGSSGAVDVATKSSARKIERNYADAVKGLVMQHVGSSTIEKLLAKTPGKKVFDQATTIAQEIVKKQGLPETIVNDIAKFITLRNNGISSGDAMIELSKISDSGLTDEIYKTLLSKTNAIKSAKGLPTDMYHIGGLSEETQKLVKQAEDKITESVTDSVKITRLKQGLMDIIEGVSQVASEEGIRSIASMIEAVHTMTSKTGDIGTEAARMLSSVVDILMKESDVDLIGGLTKILTTGGELDFTKLKSFSANYNIPYEKVIELEKQQKGMGMRALLINKITTDGILSGVAGVTISPSKRFNKFEDVTKVFSDIIADSLKHVASAMNDPDAVYEAAYSMSHGGRTTRKLFDSAGVGREFARFLLVGDSTSTNPGVRDIIAMITEEMKKVVPDLTKLPYEFLGGHGSDMLSKTMNFKDIAEEVRFNNAILLARKKAGAKGQLGIVKLYNTYFKDGVLSTSFNGGSLLDMIGVYIDPRKSVGAIRGLGGAISRPILDLTKYVLDTDMAQGLEMIGKTMGDYFNRSKLAGSLSNRDVIEFTSKMGVASESEAYVKLYDEVYAILSSKGVAAIHDKMNPLLYTVDDFVKKINNSTLSPTDTVLGILSSRGKNGAISIEGFDELAEKVKGLEGVGDGFEIRNLISHMMEESAKGVVKGMESMNISKDNMYRYLFKDLGNTLSHSITGDATNAFGSRLQLSIDYIKSIAKKKLPTNEIAAFENKLNNHIQNLIERTENGVVTSEGLKQKSDELIEGIQEIRDLVKGFDDGAIAGDLDDMVEAFSTTDVGRGFIESTIRKVLGEQKNMDDIILDAADYLKGSEDRLVLQDVVNRAKNTDIHTQIQTDLYKGDTSSLERLLTAEGRSPEDIKSTLDYMKTISKDPKNPDKFLDRDELVKQITEGAGVWDLIDANPKFKKSIKEFLQSDSDMVRGAGQKMYLEGRNNLVVRHIEHLTGVKKFLSSMVTPSVLANTNKQMSEIIGEIQNMGKQYITPKSNSQIADSAISLSGYIKKATQKMQEVGKNVSDSEFKEVLSILNKSSVSARKDVADYGLSDGAVELVSTMLSYLDDINEFRMYRSLGAVSFSQVMVNGRKGDSALKNNTIQILTGKWTHLSVNDHDAIIKSFGDIKNFQKDFLYGGLYQKGSPSKQAFNNLTEIAIKYGALRLFNIAGGGYKAGQQIISNFVESDAFIKSSGIDEELLNDLSNLVTKYSDFSLLKGDKFSEGASNTKISSIFNTIINYTSALTRGDKLSESKVMKSSIGLALYDKAQAFGITYVEDVITKAKQFDEFVGTHGFQSAFEVGTSFGQKRALGIYEEILARDGQEAAKAFSKEFEGVRKFYKTDYEDIISKTRAYNAAFFVSDKVPEFNFSPLVSNNKWGFGLMKWAVNKTGDYALRITQAFSDAKGLTGFARVNKIAEHPVRTQLARQITVGLKFNGYIDSITSEEGEGGFGNRDGVLSGIVPSVASMMMLVGDTVVKSTREYLDTDQQLGQGKAILSAVIEAATSLGGRMFIYENMMSNNIVSIVKTQSEIDYDVVDGSMIEGIVTDFLKTFISGRDRYNNTKVGGMKFDNVMNNPNVTIFEYMLNVKSGESEDFQRSVDKMYGLYDYEGKLNLNYLKSKIPIIGAFISDGGLTQATLQREMEEYYEKSGLSILTNEFAPQQEVETVMDQINLMTMMSKAKEKKIKQDSSYKEMVDQGVIDLKSPIWDTVLGSDDKYDKGLDKFISNAVDPEMEKILNEYRQGRITGDKTKPYKVKDGDFEQFVSYATRRGSQAELKDYMKAFYTGYGNIAKENMFGKKKITYNKDTGSDAYYKYVDSMNKLSTNLVKNNRHLLARERENGTNLINNYIKVDPNMPVKKYQEKISDLSSNLSVFTNLKIADDIGMREGYSSDSFLNATAALVMKGANIVKNIPMGDDLDNPRDVQALKRYTNIMSDLAMNADEDNDPGRRALKKMFMATATLPFISNLNDIDQKSVDNILEMLGKENVERVVDMYTDSYPVHIDTAYALVTGDQKDPNKGDSNGKKSSPRIGGIPDNKSKSKIPQILLNNFNKAVQGAKALSKKGLNLSPRKFTYEQGQDGSLVRVAIDIPRAEAIPASQGNGGGSAVRGRTRFDRELGYKRSKVLTTTNSVKKLPKSSVSTRSF